MESNKLLEKIPNSAAATAEALPSLPTSLECETVGMCIWSWVFKADLLLLFSP